MKQLLWSLTVVAALVGARTAQAQGFGGYTPPPTNPYPNRPLISPYLNIARGGSTALNYYTSTVPQMQYNNQLQNLQVTTQQLTVATGALAQQPRTGGGLYQTGHAVRFMDYNRYFQTLGGGMGGAMSGVGMMPNSGVLPPQQVPLVNPQMNQQRFGNMNQPR